MQCDLQVVIEEIKTENGAEDATAQAATKKRKVRVPRIADGCTSIQVAVLSMHISSMMSGSQNQFVYIASHAHDQIRWILLCQFKVEFKQADAAALERPNAAKKTAASASKQQAAVTPSTKDATKTPAKAAAKETPATVKKAAASAQKTPAAKPAQSPAAVLLEGGCCMAEAVRHKPVKVWGRRAVRQPFRCR